MRKKLLFVFGTRPEVIKLAPLINRAKQNPAFDVVVCSTGQHREMVAPFLELFNLNLDYDLELMKQKPDLGELVSQSMSGVSKLIKKEKPDYVIVQGDTATCMAAGMAAFLEKTKVVHVEAGLRSGDMFSPWPEEFNRRVVGLTSTIHCAPTKRSASNLKSEGYPERDVFITGNTVIDALFDARKIMEKGALPALEKKYSFLNSKKRLILVTTHRRESFGEGLKNIFETLVTLSEQNEVQILFAVHLNPEVRKTVTSVLGGKAKWVGEAGFESASIILCDPLPYLDFIYLMDKSYFIMSDSGGVQEEAPALGKPVLVLREVTERVEAIESGCAVLVGSEKTKIISFATELLKNGEKYKSMSNASNPFGDGKASDKILETILKYEN